MNQVSCSSCGASFDVDFAPGTEFTCGACGAIVVVPAPAPPRVMPRAGAPRPAPAGARPAPAGARRPGAGRPAVPPPPPGARGPSKALLFTAIGITAAVLLALAIFMVSTGRKTPDVSPPSPPPVGPKPAAPVEASPAAGTPDTAPERPAEPPAAPRTRPSDPIGAAKFDAETPGAGSLQKLAFADLAYEKAEQLETEGKRDEAAKLRRDALAFYGDVLTIEKDQERARERLGFVKFDLTEAKRLEAMPNLPRKVKAGIGEVIEQVEEKTKGKRVAWPLWMSVKGGPFEDFAGDWRRLVRRAKDFETLEKAKQSDDFYRRAASMASSVEGDVGPVLKKRKVEGATFDVYPTKPYVVIVQRDADYDTQEVAEQWTDTLMQLRETFLARFRKLDLPPMDRPTPLLLLHYNTDYARYLRRADEKGAPATGISSQAHFEPWSKRLVTWKDPDRTDRSIVPTVSEDEVRTVLFHEGTHQLVDYYTKTRASNLDESLWFSEGIADYFGGHGRTWDETAGKWRYEPGLINVERVTSIGDSMKGGFLFKLRDLLAYRRGDYQRDKEADPAKTSLAYAQGWALVYLLSNWEDNKYRDKFDEYVKKELNGESGVAAFEAVFGAAAIDGIEKELHAMIGVLHQAAKDKKIVNGKMIK